MVEDTQERVIGLLLGLAAGDRIGGPVRMALHVAESLLDRGGLDVSDVGQRYLQWWRNGAFDTGPTVARVLALVEGGMSFERAAAHVDENTGEMTAGSNPAHRCAPLAMCISIRDCGVAGAARSEARMTHRHPVAGDVAAAVACLCRSLIRGTTWSLALTSAATDRRPETRWALESAAPPLSAAGFAPDVIRAAVHFVGSSTSFPEALDRSLEFAGPANYCPVLVGSIGGARWGSVPMKDTLLAHHRDLVPRIKAVAVSLASPWQRPEV